MDILNTSFSKAWPKLSKQAISRARHPALKPTHSSNSFTTRVSCTLPFHNARSAGTSCLAGLATTCSVSTLPLRSETKPAAQPHTRDQPPSTALPTTHESASGPTSDTKPRTDRSPNPGPEPGPGGPDDPPGGGGLPFRIRYWILLLAEYGGVYGTAAVLIAALTHIDPFGGLHWDASDVSLGLMLLAPVMAFDALVGLPDWSSRTEDAAALVRLFVDPDLLPPHPARQQQQQQEQQQGSEESQLTTSHQEPMASSTTSTTVPRSASGLEASTSPSSPSPSPSPSSRGPVWVALQRLRMALELMQESQVRNNPGARLNPAQEAALIAVAVTADEMLYRAVVLTLFGRWLRDRLYEAGAEEMMVLPSLPYIGGGGGTGVWEVDTASVGVWGALAVGSAAGVAVFMAKAWQEARLAERVKAVRRAEREEAAKALRKQRLQGRHVTEEEEAREAAEQARLEAAHRSLAESIGLQGALVWGLEGGREVYQVTAAGAAFLLTGNLAAPLAGALLSQTLVSVYQRLGMQRAMQRRVEALAKRRTALQEQQQPKEGEHGVERADGEGDLKQQQPPQEEERGADER